MTRTTASRAPTGGVALVVLSALCYGTVPVSAKLAFAAGMTLPAFLSWRFAAAAALVWAIALLTRAPLPDRRTIWPLCAMGAVGYAGQSAAFFASLSWLPAPMTALLLYTYPAIVTIASALLLRERLTAQTTVAVAVAFVGTCLIVGAGGLGAAPIGVACALLSAVIYSAYILFGSRLFASAPPLSASAVVMTATAGSYVLYALLSHAGGVPATSAQAEWLAAAALIGTAVPILCFVAGMPRIGPSRASILSTFEPVVTVILSAIVLGESLRPIQIAGASCVLVSVLVLEMRRADGPAQI